jgi:phosphotransferase system enzyme I (PtsP)
VADLYHSFHPAVLQALADVAAAAREEGKPVSICGELAGEPSAAVLLLAMGYDGLSMNAPSVPRVKRALRNLRFREATDVLKEVMEMEEAASVHARLDRFLVEHGMEQFIHNPVF